MLRFLIANLMAIVALQMERFSFCEEFIEVFESTNVICLTLFILSLVDACSSYESEFGTYFLLR